MTVGPRVCLIGTYPPRQCGIATFTHDLCLALTGLTPPVDTSIVAITDAESDYAYGAEVVYEIRDGQVSDYRAAAEFINNGDFDVVCLQHEFGIMGGAHGKRISELLDHLSVPVVSTLHTVVADPEAGYRASMQRVVDVSARIIVLNSLAVPILEQVYRVDPAKVEVIPHGVPDVPFLDPAFHKDVLGAEGRSVLLTFGHLSRNKGIEVVLDALPAVVARHPDLLYVVLGATHPEVRKREGEQYRESLQQRVADLGLEGNVEFQDHYVELDELVRYLTAADVYVTPYQSRDQIVSGTLAYAVGAGKAVVSTPYRHAEELLADGRGRLFDFGDSAGLADQLLELLEDETVRTRVRKAAYAYGRNMTWPVVGARHRSLFGDVATTAEAKQVPAASAPRPVVPALSLAYLARLHDGIGTGIVQHTTGGIPELRFGATTDDVGRSLVVTVEQLSRGGGELAERLAAEDLAFLRAAQRSDGTFENLLTFDRRWVDGSASDDTLGQAVWGLGSVVAVGPEAWRPLARTMLDQSLPAISELRSPRSVAYAMCGLYSHLSRYPGALAVRRTLGLLAERLVALRAVQGTDDWRWYEDVLAYGNAKLPQAVLLAARALDRPDWQVTGLETLDWLLDQIWAGDRFEFVGNEGWHHRGGERATYGQQPIEAGYTAEACMVAYELTGRPRYLERARAAVQWLTGRNRLGIALYDPATGACVDGLDRHGASANAGAESTICALLGLQAVPDAWSSVPGPAGVEAPLVLEAGGGALGPTT